VGPTRSASSREQGSGRRRTTRIALLVEVLGNPYVDPIFGEIMATARARDVDVLCLVGGLTPTEIASGVRHISHLATSALVDGILLISLGAGLSAAEISAYCQRYHPLPMCSIAVPWKDHPRVIVDNEPGMRQGIEHLIEVHGYRHIAFVRGPEASEEAELRYRVYREVLAAHRIAFDPALVAPGWFIIQSGIEAVRLFLDERKVKVDAIACANDGMAFGVMRELTARGIAIPGQVAVLGFDDAEGSHYYEPPLTTVRQPLHEQAREAFDVLLRLIAGDTSARARVLPTELVVRQSCGCKAHGTNHRQSDGRTSNPASPTRDEILAAMAEVRAPIAPGGPSLEDLFDAFAGDLSHGGTAFFGRLDAALRGPSESRRDVGIFQRLITVLEERGLAGMSDSSETWRRAQKILHAARVLVSVVAERVPAGRKQRYEDYAHKLLRANQDLMEAKDLRTLSSVAAKHLPEFGVASCYISLYTDEAPPGSMGGESKALLVLAEEAGRELELPAEGVQFPTPMLLPFDRLSDHRRQTLIAFSIERQGSSPGYVVFEYGPQEAFVYELLVNQISAAYRRIETLELLVEEARLRHAAERERLEKEVRVAQHIQTGLLPRRFDVAGLAISAASLRSAPTGGDYYDVIPLKDGCLISIGSVSGDGLPAGLAMLMLQSVVSGVVRSSPDDPPSAILPFVQAVVSENIHKRMGQRQRVELTLIRYRSQGTLTVAGTHAGLLISSADGHTQARRPSLVAGIEPTHSSAGRERGSEGERRVAHAEITYDLALGDVFLLYTGAGSRPGGQGDAFDPAGLAQVIEGKRGEPVGAISDALTAQMSPRARGPRHDITLLVAKHGITERREVTV
jgi:DNA-binding LacI/PurR family transcriptional regulator